PDRGASPWGRGLLHDHQILVCPACQEQRDWTAQLDRCGRCGSAHLVRRLDEVECRDCGLIRLTGAAPAVCPAHGPGGPPTGPSGRSAPASPDPELAAEVERALAKVLGKVAKIIAAP
ncbi:MAG TPA: hypothetical protein VGD68_13750, partial [Streptosporangiaceae bacterium]